MKAAHAKYLPGFFVHRSARTLLPVCLNSFSFLEGDFRDKKMEPQFPKVDNYPNFVSFLKRELEEEQLKYSFVLFALPMDLVQ